MQAGFIAELFLIQKTGSHDNAMLQEVRQKALCVMMVRDSCGHFYLLFYLKVLLVLQALQKMYTLHRRRSDITGEHQDAMFT